MVVYFANRTMDILGLASTELMEGFHISDDRKTEDIDTGVAVFECTIHWTEDSRLLAKTCATAGNYLLRSNDEEAEFYTIIEVEEDTKDQTIYIYAEDAGMDLLNETVGAFEADEAHPAAWYIEMFADDSGFEIGINEITSLSRKLEWTGEATVAERIASVATQFDNAEVSYSFEISGLTVTKKYINIYKQRGKDVGVTLRLNREVDRIVTTTSVADLATALYVTGGIVEGEEEPITLAGYSATADDGDIYTTGDGYVRSKSALAIWSRYLNPSETGTGTGDIVKQWSYDTTSQSELFNRSVTQLQKIYTPAVNYDIEITNMPDNVAIGDNVYIVDEGGDVYLQARILQMETSVCNETQRLTLGDYLINSGGLSSQVSSLTTQLASVQSQATSTAADVYNLNEEVSELSSSTVKTNGSVEITLYNNSGSASGSFSFANGLSLDIKELFTSYALLSETAQIRLYSDYGYAYDQFGFQSPLNMSIQNLLPDMSNYASKSDSATITIKTSDASESGNFSFSGGCEIDISDLVGGGGGSGSFDEVIIGSGNTTMNLTADTSQIAITEVVSNGDKYNLMAVFGWTVVLGCEKLDTYIGGGCIYIGTTTTGETGVIEIGNSDLERISMAGKEIRFNGSTIHSSDERLKTSIEPLTTSSLDNLTPVSFKWRDNPNKTHYGYIAQEVQPHFPELVREGTDGMLGLAYTEIIPLLHCKIKEQQSKIESLEERITRLEELINEHT